ncbi:MAG: N,N'-diacetylbacillosaminyl-diphospho-undecaprenol alpha-1,3-N-acetylgalactosaminyltransferase [candidate division BRC1 bacterium ADurb.BinA364]|nr:MAG: N,N'-diacetylbacillosaminyl-diphospho-undecaprenol alpha-1,3-N-acetylgalactosaminyltransferase [candidate division BRC1 bacterium ADurb.BinA364]
MRALLVSSSDSSGGAAIAARRLLDGLIHLGVDARMLVRKKRSSHERVIGPGPWARLLEAAASKLDRLPLALGRVADDYASPGWVGGPLGRRVRNERPDIVHLHWICGGMARVESLPRLPAPAVWTLHDMWAFCGAEHCAGRSRRYIEGYRAGNRPAGERGADIGRWTWERKRRSWSAWNKLAIVAPSRWMAQCARESLLFRDRRIETIPNGLNCEVFRPRDKIESRRALGLPEQRRLILFGAAPGSYSLPRKGVHLLPEVFSLLRQAMPPIPSPRALSYGARSPGAAMGGLGVDSLGILDSDERLALACAACDVFVLPSLQENLPNCIMEAMACGVPVAAFDVGGVGEMIEHRTDGWLARPGDAADLAEGLRWILAHPNPERLGAAAREKALRDYAIDTAAKRYRDLYEDLLQ